MQKRVRTGLIIPLLIALACPSMNAYAVQLFGIERRTGGDGSDLILIDTNSFSDEKIGGDTSRRIGALTVHPETGDMFGGTGLLGTGPASLVTIDPENGRVRNRGFVGNFDKVTAIAFDGDGNLYATEGFKLVQVDDRGRILKDFGFMGTGSLTGMAFNPADNTMYGVENVGGRFVSIDLTSGDATRLGSISFPPAEEGDPPPTAAGLTFDNNGQAYVSTGGGDGRLFTLNTSNFRVEEIGDIGNGSLSALAFAGGDVFEPGDFDENGVFDIADLDLLHTQLVFGTNDEKFDVTGDAMVNGDDLSFWVKEIKKTWIGDSNLDGEFNSADLVNIFQSAKFEKDEAATWGQGDWTGDNRFGSSDLVAAFEDGGFELGPRAATASVPEPSGLILLLGGALLVFTRRKRR